MVSVKRSNNQRLSILQNSLSLPKEEVIQLLLDVYELESIDEFIRSIQRKRNAGLSAQKLNNLSILFSYLAKVFEPFTK
jgi:hypothetical protein